MISRNQLILCFACFILVSCTTPYNKPEIIGDSDTPIRALGIVEVLNQEGVDEIDVLMIHGMCTHDQRWVAKSTNNLLKVLKIDNEMDPDALQPTKVFDDQTELYSLKFEKEGKRVRTHSIVWSPPTIPLKSRLCYDHSEDRADSKAYCQGAPKYPYDRAWLNGKLKSSLLDDCLADAVIYVGPTKTQIRDQVASAITFAAGIRSTAESTDALRLQAEKEQTPRFIISESPGGKVLFDTLIDMLDKNQKRLVKQTVERVCQIYMTANQIPMLALAAPVDGKHAESQTDKPGIGRDSLGLLLRELEKITLQESYSPAIRRLLPLAPGRS